MKRYLVFAGFRHYPLGGFLDFVSDHVDLKDAFAAARKAGGNGYDIYSSDWWQVVDTRKRMVWTANIEKNEKWVKITPTENRRDI